MGIFNKKPKLTQEQKILETKVDLKMLQKKYESLMTVQRQILRGKPTPHEKELAESKIRSALCAYTICSRAYEDLEEITSDLELNSSLKQLNRSLKTVNRLGKKTASPFTRASINHNVDKIYKREQAAKPGEIFSDDTLGTVDEWLGSKWENVANKYISGSSLKSCLDETRVLLETDPIPMFEDSVFGDSGSKVEFSESENNLKDLLNSDIF